MSQKWLTGGGGADFMGIFIWKAKQMHNNLWNSLNMKLKLSKNLFKKIMIVINALDTVWHLLPYQQNV